MPEGRPESTKPLASLRNRTRPPLNGRLLLTEVQVRPPSMVWNSVLPLTPRVSGTVAMIQALVVVWKKAPPIEEIPGIVTLYQVTPPSLVRSTYELPIAQPLNESNIRKPRITGEGWMVPGMVIGVFVGVRVGGTCSVV